MEINENESYGNQVIKSNNIILALNQKWGSDFSITTSKFFFKEEVRKLWGDENTVPLIFWKFSPGRRASLWKEFEKRKIIAMGSAGTGLGSLRNYSTFEDLQKVPDFPISPNDRADYSHQLIRFRDELKPGNIIVAYGKKSIYGFGKIPEDSTYQFDDKEGVDWWGTKQPGLQHWRKVDWLKVFENRINISENEELYQDLSQNDTIHLINADLTEKLKNLMGEIGSGSVYPTREQFEKAIKRIGINNTISKQDIFDVLEKIMKEENIMPNADWKSKTWDNIKSWAEKTIK